MWMAGQIDGLAILRVRPPTPRDRAVAEGRMDQLSDSALVELAKAGDQAAFAELYTRWFDPVYDFLARMVRNRDEAADVAQDTFLKAMNALGGLQKGASFKSWIFTIARNTALNRIEKSGRTRPIVFEGEDGEEVSLDVVDTDRFGSPEEAAEARAMSSLVWEAAAGLDPKQLTLLDLHLRQGLDSGEIAGVLGVTKNNGYVMLNRLKKAVEDAIGAFIMFKDGRRYCDELDTLLSVATVDGMSPDVRKLVDGHVSTCEECEERKKKLLSPLAVFGAFAAVPMPIGAKAHILDGLMREWPGPATGGGVGGPPPEDGPGAVPGDGDGPNKPNLTEKLLANGARLIVGGAAAAVLFLFGVLVFPVLTSGDDDGNASPGDQSPVPTSAIGGGSDTPTATSTVGTSQSQPSPTTTSFATATATAGNTASPTNTVGPGTPTPTRTATATPTRTPTATATPTRTATLTPTPTTIPCEPSLSTNTSTLNIPPGGGSSFVLLASPCGTANYTITGGGGWAITEGGGSVSFGAPRTIQVNVDASGLGEGSHSTTLEIAGPYNSDFVTVNTTVGGGSPIISGFSVSCSAFAVTFAATITDDIGVSSASVSYALTNGPSGAIELDQSGNSWSATISRATPGQTVASAVLTASDAAGHEDVQTASLSC
jgi:RNA polymerase sigma factor (sigma-70 family)